MNAVLIGAQMFGQQADIADLKVADAAETNIVSLRIEQGQTLERQAGDIKKAEAGAGIALVVKAQRPRISGVVAVP